MTEKFNSGTQYGDIHGNITIDNSDGGGLHEFSKEFDIDTDVYFPIGIDIYIEKDNYIKIDIIAIDNNNIRANYVDIKDYFEKNNVVDVKKINLPKATFNDYLKHCKRFSIAAASLPELMGKTINIK